MQTFQVCTWNVLHRYHAEDKMEECLMTLERYPSEAHRASEVANLVEQMFVQGCRTVCLQEVSGDLLNVLRERLGKKVTIFDHVHTRVPVCPDDVPAKAMLKKDRAEYLVLLTDFPAAKPLIGSCFSTAPGKGVLGVQLQDNVAVFNVHLSPGKSGEKQIRDELMISTVLPFLKKNRQNQAVITGDFARDLDKVCFSVGELAYCGGEDLTQFHQQGMHTRGDKDIDHIIGVGGVGIGNAVLYPNANLSTHQPLKATVGSRINSPALGAAGTRSGFRDYSADTVNP